jgi:hypothetical protein
MTKQFTAPRHGRAVTLQHLRAAESAGIDCKLYCRRCHAEYSTDVGDYSFWRSDSDPFKCCGVNNLLLVRHHASCYAP